MTKRANREKAPPRHGGGKGAANSPQANRVGSTQGKRQTPKSGERLANGVDPFLAQHAPLALRETHAPQGRSTVLVNEAESPLAWLARRKGRNGQALIAPAEFLAGERLRADFTRAQLTPRVTANWTASVASGRRADGRGAADFSDAVLAAKERVRHALDAVGPEFAGLLLDVCCFLKGLDLVETERQWPARSAKVVLQLGLARLARHYGLDDSAQGRPRQTVRTWLADDARFAVESL